MTTQASAKRRGSSFEIDLEGYLLGNPMVMNARRLPRSGSLDRGDLSFELRLRGVESPLSDHVIVTEAKAPGKGRPMSLPAWWREAEVEAVNHQNAYSRYVTPLLVVKAFGKPTSQAWAIQPLERWLDEH